jgi:hypothetical protein
MVEQWSSGMVGLKEFDMLENGFSVFITQYSSVPTFHYSRSMVFAEGIEYPILLKIKKSRC